MCHRRATAAQLEVGFCLPISGSFVISHSEVSHIEVSKYFSTIMLFEQNAVSGHAQYQ